MTGFFEAGHAARRALHRDRPGREGLESELVERLTAELTPAAARRTLARCLEGGLTPHAALAQLLFACRSVGAVRELVDEVTARADEDSRAGDALVRDRADALTRLFVENAPACARALARWERGGAGVEEMFDRLYADVADGDGADAVRRHESAFARLVEAGAEGADGG